MLLGFLPAAFWPSKLFPSSQYLLGRKLEHQWLAIRGH